MEDQLFNSNTHSPCSSSWVDMPKICSIGWRSYPATLTGMLCWIVSVSTWTSTDLYSSLCNMHCLLRLTLIVPCNFSRSIYTIQSKVRCLTEVLVTLATEIFLFSSALPSKTDSHLSHTENIIRFQEFSWAFFAYVSGALFLFAGETWLCS